MPRLLLVDDDVELCGLIRDFFAERDFQVEMAHDGRQGLARALEGGFDLVLLDVMLPVLDGFGVLNQLRRRSNVPVIMLTARTEQEDRIAGLDAGADDYLPKPFGPEELVARVRAVLRRTMQASTAPAAAFEAGTLRIDASHRQAWVEGEAVSLTSIEFDILDALARSMGRIVSRDELATVLYQRPATPYERSLDVHISHLRKKLEHCRTLSIRTVRGVGYLFTPAGAGGDSGETA